MKEYIVLKNEGRIPSSAENLSDAEIASFILMAKAQQDGSRAEK